MVKGKCEIRKKNDNMEMTLRWYGSKSDSVTLEQIRTENANLAHGNGELQLDKSLKKKEMESKIHKLISENSKITRKEFVKRSFDEKCS